MKLELIVQARQRRGEHATGYKLEVESCRRRTGFRAGRWEAWEGKERGEAREEA